MTQPRTSDSLPSEGDYGFLHALAGNPHPGGHEIRQLQPDRELCSRCKRRPSAGTEGLCESCKDVLADIRDNWKDEEDDNRGH